ncbi:MAG: DNA mismatch repair endonuclease MutL [Eubacteriales bacterium]|nr:DNA mismatch repair endonuclease MutL [Eubacteriales bacterium]
MGIINLLDLQVANLIAAGEVVDRPASVVKELMENAIDAGAAHITVEIKNGGISFIRVSDDGCGMSREDVAVSILRHATSKIKIAPDLDGIQTLGFRGEALAAIAAVSKLRIMTKRIKDSTGTLMVSVAGNINDITDIGSREGTTVIVEDLFANIPARRKFLKRDAAEAMAVTAVVEKIALSKPGVAVKHISDGNVRFDTSGDGKLLNTIYAVLGREFAKKMIQADGLTEGVSVTGYISSPDNIRGNRNYQNLFLNGRYIKSNTVTAALEDAYNSYIPADRFPCCVLNITIHPAYVDVNVHPTKLEVKFSNEKIIYNGVYCAVRNALNQRTNRPEMRLHGTVMTGEDVRIINAFTSISDNITEEDEKKEEQVNIFDKPELLPDDAGSTQQTEPEPASRAAAVNGDIIKTEVKPAETETESESETPVSFYRIIGTAFNAYIFVQLEESVLVIDKHAAHERIIFEEMKRNMKRGGRYSQMLMIPAEVALTGIEHQSLSEYKSEIEATGIEFVLQEKTAEITAIPSGLTSGEASDVLVALAGKLSENTGSVNTARDIVFERALYQASCKAALKAGREDSEANTVWLCEQLMRLPDVTYCPHGRPTAFEITKHSLERQFKRI